MGDKGEGGRGQKSQKNWVTDVIYGRPLPAEMPQLLYATLLRYIYPSTILRKLRAFTFLVFIQ